MNAQVFDLPEELNKFYKLPYDYATLELIFDEQLVNKREGMNKNESSNRGLYRLFVQKVPKNHEHSKLIFHITENPIGDFSFEPIYYGSQKKFKDRIVEPKPDFIENGIIEIHWIDALELTFNIRKEYLEQNSSPVRVLLRYNKLKTAKTHIDDSDVSGFNRIASIVNLKNK